MFKVDSKVARPRCPEIMGLVTLVSTDPSFGYRVEWRGGNGAQWGWYTEAQLIEWDGDTYGQATEDGYGNGI